MAALSAPALVASMLLALAGAQKLLNPIMTMGALRGLGLPSSSLVVRLGSVAELAVGIAAIAVGGRLPWALATASYAAFALFVLAALRRGAMIGTCGCFGREDTPPHVVHVGLNLALMAVCGAATWASLGSITQAAVDHPGDGVLVVCGSVIALVFTYATMVVIPRTLTAAHPNL